MIRDTEMNTSVEIELSKIDLSMTDSNKIEADMDVMIPMNKIDSAVAALSIIRGF